MLRTAMGEMSTEGLRAALSVPGHRKSSHSLKEQLVYQTSPQTLPNGGKATGTLSGSEGLVSI